MVNFCMAPGCSNRATNSKVSFHRLPLNDLPRLKKWLSNMKLKDPPVSKNSRVCSDHFADDCYERDLKAELTNSKTKMKLKEKAIPTIFDFSSYKPNFPTRPKKLTQARKLRIENREKRKVMQKIHKDIEKEIAAEHGNSSCFQPIVSEDTSALDTKQIVEEVAVASTHRSIATQTDSSLSKCAACAQLSCQPMPSHLFSLVEKVGMNPVMCLPENRSSVKESDSSESDYMEVHDVSYEQSSENESDHIIGEEDEKEGISIVKEDKFIVFASCLFSLLAKKCLADPCCTAPAEITTTSTKGTMLSVTCACLNHHTFKWKSQPVIDNAPSGNLLLAAATLYSGNTYSTLAEICKSLNLRIFGKTDFYYIQKTYLLPSISHMWSMEQSVLLESYKNRDDLVLAGDGRCDSPGHSATYGTYSLMDTQNNKILAFNVVKVTEVKNSYGMENEGLIRCLNEVQEAGIRIATLATDRHPQVTKTIRSLFPSISHQFDVWHLAKSITKKLNSASKTKENENLQPWIRSIVNHFWWSTETCNKDPKQLKSRWVSILHHITNQHSWLSDAGYNHCAHEPLTEQEQRHKAWLQPGSFAHRALQSVVLDKRLLQDMGMVAEFCHTGSLESFHSMLLKYLPKRLSFSYEGMVARTMLAVLDNNMNSSLEHQETREGEKCWVVQWSKRSRSFIVKRVSESKDYSFRDNLMECTLAYFKQTKCESSASESFRSNTVISSSGITVPPMVRRSIGEGEKPSTSEAIQRHISRFR